MSPQMMDSLWVREYHPPVGMPGVLPFHGESALSQRCILVSGSVCSTMLSFQAEFAAVFLSTNTLFKARRGDIYGTCERGKTLKQARPDLKPNFCEFFHPWGWCPPTLQWLKIMYLAFSAWCPVRTRCLVNDSCVFWCLFYWAILFSGTLPALHTHVCICTHTHTRSHTLECSGPIG